MCPYLKTMKVRENKHSCEASLNPNSVFSLESDSPCSGECYDTCPKFLAYVLRASVRPLSGSRNTYRKAA